MVVSNFKVILDVYTYLPQDKLVHLLEELLSDLDKDVKGDEPDDVVNPSSSIDHIALTGQRNNPEKG